MSIDLLKELGIFFKEELLSDRSKEYVDDVTSTVVGIGGPITFSVPVRILLNCLPNVKPFRNLKLLPYKKEDSLNNFDIIHGIICGGLKAEEFQVLLRKYDSSSVCGLVWTANFVAYRCKTCACSSCMALCAECFLSGNHEGHDFNMFKSQAGGACDCGDPNVLKEEGFCKKHRSKFKEVTPVPPDLLVPAEYIIPRLLLRLIIVARVGFLNKDSYYEPLVSYLQKLCLFSEVMRSAVTRAILSPDVYSEMKSSCADKENDLWRTCQATYEEKLSKLESPPMDAIDPYFNFPRHIVHNSFLDEILFWTVKHFFPTSIVTWLLNMLPDSQYKIEFSASFLRHYTRIALCLMTTDQAEAVTNSVVHISVQLLSNEKLALDLAENNQLLDILIATFAYLIGCVLEECLLTPNDSSSGGYHFVANASHKVIKDNCYWPTASDLANIFNHKTIAAKFLESKPLLKVWIDTISKMTGMNVNTRMLDEHVVYENQVFYSSFTLEIESALIQMIFLLNNADNNRKLLVNMLEVCSEALIDFASAVNIGEKVVRDQVSFHLPLHRYFSTFLSTAIAKCNYSFVDLPVDLDFYRKVLYHPLQIMACIVEINSKMWVRSGKSMLLQVSAYLQSHFTYLFVDPDVFILQLGAITLEPDWFILRVLDFFSVKEFFQLGVDARNPRLSSATESDMLYGALMLFGVILTNRIQLGMDSSQATKLELLTLLSFSDCTHSQLTESLERNRLAAHSNDEEKFLSEIAVYNPPSFQSDSTMKQGMYVPKKSAWLQLFDPIHSYLRSCSRGDYRSSISRFSKFAFSERLTFSEDLWPPYRPYVPPMKQYQQLEKIFASKAFHAVIYIVFYKFLYGKDSVCEDILGIALHLLSLCLDTVHNVETQVSQLKFDGPVRDYNYFNWFRSNNILVNCVHEIKEVISSTSSREVSSPEEQDVFVTVPSKMMPSSASTSLTSRKKHDVLCIHEDLISLLVKSYNKLAPLPLQSNQLELSPAEVPIGNGPKNIIHVLSRIALMSELCKERMLQLMQAPSPVVSSSRISEKRLRAKERQQKLMADFALRQKAFLDTNLEMDEDEQEDVTDSAKQYFCIICGVAAASTSELPFVMTAFIQPSKVLGCRVPLNCSRSISNPTEHMLASEKESYLYECAETLFGANVVAQSAFGCSKSPSVVLQTCLHCVHTKCLQSYRASLNNPQFALPSYELIEYDCPLCRKLINSTLPLSQHELASQPCRKKQSLDLSYNTLYVEEAMLRFTQPSDDLHIDSLVKIFSIISVPSTFEFADHSLWTQILSKVAKDYFTMFILNGNTPQKQGFAPMFQAFNVSLQYLSREDSNILKFWRVLSGVESPSLNQFPFLLMDPFTLLFNFLLNVPMPIDIGTFTCISRLVFSLAQVKAMIFLCEQLPLDEQNAWVETASKNSSNAHTSTQKFATVIKAIQEIGLVDSPTNEVAICGSIWTEKSIEDFILNECSHLIRELVLLKDLIFQSSSSTASVSLQDQCEPLNEEQIKNGLQFLGLFEEASFTKCEIAFSSDLTWSLIHQVKKQLQRSKSNVKFLMDRREKYGTPHLIQLPNEFSELFQMYRFRKCSVCGTAPTNPTVCLVCGNLLCLQGKCCRNRETSIYECCEHAISCGGGVIPILWISSTQVILIRGSKSSIWGHLHLDAFGEEDKDLRRGKPLHLSKERYGLLQNQWMYHSYDASRFKWFLHSNRL